MSTPTSLETPCFLQLFADHPVSCAEVEHPQPVDPLLTLRDRGAQNIYNGCWRLALQPLVDDLLVQARNVEDAFVVMQPNLLLRIPVQQIEVDLVLTQLAHIGGRKLNSMSLCHSLPSLS